MRGVAFALSLGFGVISSLAALGLALAPLGLAAEPSPAIEESATDAVPVPSSNALPTVVTETSLAMHWTDTPAASPPPAPASDASPLAEAPGAGAVVDAGPLSSEAKARELFEAQNAAREDHGLHALEWSAELESVAFARAEHLARHGYFGHYGPDGHSAFAELAARGLEYTLAGENLARNDYPDADSVQVAFTALMASPGHRENILEARFSRAGIAAVRTGAIWLYVTVFTD